MGMIIRDVCPRCQSPKYKKNGHIQNGKRNHQCKDCGRQFVDGFEQYLISDETRDLIGALGVTAGKFTVLLTAIDFAALG